jgi:hypothetical protein
MNDDYVGPDMQTVPIGWFREAIEVAERAAPGGYNISIQVFANGFEVVASLADKVATEQLTFFDMAMEAESGNPFPRCIRRAVDALRG